MTDSELRDKTNAKIERLYDAGLELTIKASQMQPGSEQDQTRERGRLTFLAGMDIACRATERHIKFQKSKLEN